MVWSTRRNSAISAFVPATETGRSWRLLPFCATLALPADVTGPRVNCHGCTRKAASRFEFTKHLIIPSHGFKEFFDIIWQAIPDDLRDRRLSEQIYMDDDLSLVIRLHLSDRPLLDTQAKWKPFFRNLRGIQKLKKIAAAVDVDALCDKIATHTADLDFRWIAAELQIEFARVARARLGIDVFGPRTHTASRSLC
jgi:hypothetical protein